MITTQQLKKRLDAGELVTVRSKNGSDLPKFSRKPTAYRCSIGKDIVNPETVWRLCQRGRIEPVYRGWYTEGIFRRPSHGE